MKHERILIFFRKLTNMSFDLKSFVNFIIDPIQQLFFLSLTYGDLNKLNHAYVK